MDLGGLTFSRHHICLHQRHVRSGRARPACSAAIPPRSRQNIPGLTVQGIYSGKLDNAGETIALITPAGVTVLEVTYNRFPAVAGHRRRPGLVAGAGRSLAGTYRASTDPGGSPGADDPPISIPPVVITELLTHTDPPLLDSIELHNPTATNINLSGWFLTDDPALPWKFRIPKDLLIPAGGYAVFNESDFNPAGTGLALSSLGDETFLFPAPPPPPT